MQNGSEPSDVVFDAPKLDGLDDTADADSLFSREDKGKAKNFKVVIRVRPFLQREQGDKKVLDFQNKNRTVVIRQPLEQQSVDAPPKKHVFNFDRVYPPDSTQESVYSSAIGPVVSSVLEGYNGSIIAYGQTGTGKTFTMEGLEDDQRGVIPRAAEHVFNHISNHADEHSKYLVRVSFLQIYNEKIADLLTPDGLQHPSRSNMKIRESATGQVYVEDLTEQIVKSPREVMDLLKLGATMRATASTNMNRESSRSHAVFTLIVEHCQDNPENGSSEVTIGRLNLVDLAGSERMKKTGIQDGRRVDEMKNINTSLTAFGKVVLALTSPGNLHVPYRDSKLTRILQGSLGGNCKTTMLTAITPAESSYPETLNSLKFAKRAKHVKNYAMINQDLDHEALLSAYQREIKKLKNELRLARSQTSDAPELERLRHEHSQLADERREMESKLEEHHQQMKSVVEDKEALVKQIRQLEHQLLTGGVASSDSPEFHKAVSEVEQRLHTEYGESLTALEVERQQLHDAHLSAQHRREKLLHDAEELVQNGASSKQLLNLIRNFVSESKESRESLESSTRSRSSSLHATRKPPPSPLFRRATSESDSNYLELPRESSSLSGLSGLSSESYLVGDDQPAIVEEEPSSPTVRSVSAYQNGATSPRFHRRSPLTVHSETSEPSTPKNPDTKLTVTKTPEPPPGKKSKRQTKAERRRLSVSSDTEEQVEMTAVPDRVTPTRPQQQPKKIITSPKKQQQPQQNGKNLVKPAKSQAPQLPQQTQPPQVQVQQQVSVNQPQDQRQQQQVIEQQQQQDEPVDIMTSYLMAMKDPKTGIKLQEVESDGMSVHAFSGLLAARWFLDAIQGVTTIQMAAGIGQKFLESGLFISLDGLRIFHPKHDVFYCYTDEIRNRPILSASKSFVSRHTTSMSEGSVQYGGLSRTLSARPSSGASLSSQQRLTSARRPLSSRAVSTSALTVPSLSRNDKSSMSSTTPSNQQRQTRNRTSSDSSTSKPARLSTIFKVATLARRRKSSTQLSDSEGSQGSGPRQSYSSTSEHGATLLHSAAGSGDKAACKTFLQTFHVDCLDNLGRTPLHYAAIGNQAKTLEYLLKSGASTRVVDMHQRSALLWAAYYGFHEIVRILLKFDADLAILPDSENRTALHWAVKHVDGLCLQTLVEYTSQGVIDHYDAEQVTALHWAVLCDNSHHTQVLIKAGANVTVADSEGRTPLHYAASSLSQGCITALVRADQGHLAVNSKDNKGRTPLHVAISSQAPLELIMLMLSRDGIDVNATDARLTTPLHWYLIMIIMNPDMLLSRAAVCGRDDLCHVLVQRGAKMQFRDNRGMTALHYAMEKGHTKCASVLKALMAQQQQQSGQAQHTSNSGARIARHPGQSQEPTRASQAWA